MAGVPLGLWFSLSGFYRLNHISFFIPPSPLVLKCNKYNLKTHLVWLIPVVKVTAEPRSLQIHKNIVLIRPVQ